MDKYTCKFVIISIPDFCNWELRDHTGKTVVKGPINGYKNWHNANRALLRHIKVIQSAQFTLPPKPLRKPYTHKVHANQS